MNTHVKVALAAVIVAAIVALIVVDQTSLAGRNAASPSPSPEASTAGRPSGIVLHTPEVSTPSPDPAASIVERGQEELDRVTTGIVKGAELVEVPGPGSIKGQERPALAAPEPSPAEVYEVQQGDTLYVIAEKKYGDGNLYPLIARANPSINPNRLRIGQKLSIPARDARPAAEPAEAPVLEDPAGGKTWTVRAGDTLGEIAKRVYSTARRSVVDKIIEANPGIDVDGYNLRVGMKLALPSIDVRPAAPRVESTAAPEALAGQSTYRVLANDSLWKVAAKFRNGRDITEVMKSIVSANPGRLATTSDPLQIDWILVIPQ